MALILFRVPSAQKQGLICAPKIGPCDEKEYVHDDSPRPDAVIKCGNFTSKNRFYGRSSRLLHFNGLTNQLWQEKWWSCLLTSSLLPFFPSSIEELYLFSFSMQGGEMILIRFFPSSIKHQWNRNRETCWMLWSSIKQGGEWTSRRSWVKIGIFIDCFSLFPLGIGQLVIKSSCALHVHSPTNLNQSTSLN